MFLCHIFPAVMTSFDPQATESKTVKFIGRGDSFGDTCLMNGQARECTAISKEFIELLVLRDEVSFTLAHTFTLTRTPKLTIHASHCRRVQVNLSENKPSTVFYPLSSMRQKTSKLWKQIAEMSSSVNNKVKFGLYLYTCVFIFASVNDRCIVRTNKNHH